MSTGDRTWQCTNESGCNESFSGGEAYIVSLATQHMQDNHQKEVTPEEILAQASAPEE